MRKTTIAGLTIVALAAGIAAAEFVYRSALCREAIGRFCGRGPLLALVNQSGIYELDLKREIDADLKVAGLGSTDPNHALDRTSKLEVLARLVVNENLRQFSENEVVSEAELKREFDLLQFQFADEKLWTKRLRDCALSTSFVREGLRDDLRARRWLANNIVSAFKTDEESFRQFYAAHPEEFAQPLRIRASHLFLAAPPETPPDVVETKRKMIDSLAARIAHGEQFSQLVAEASEDEDTKLRGGDLGYFSSWRMPEEFFAAVSKFQIDEIRKPLRSHLGFHLVQITDIEPAREMTFEEARPEIVGLLTNQHRQTVVQALNKRMSGRGRYFARAL